MWIAEARAADLDSAGARAELAAEYAERVDDSRILAVEQRVMTLADAIAARYFLQGAAASRSDVGVGLA